MGDLLHYGLLEGRIPSNKEFTLYYLELTTSHLHIFDGQDTDTRQHIQSILVDRSDTVGIETKTRKGELRFFFQHSKDGKFIFKVLSEAVRETWIGKLQRVITKDGLERIEGFQAPSHNTFSLENIGSKVATPTRVDTPSVPKTTSPRSWDSRTLPSKGRVASSSVLKTSLPPPPSPPQGTGVNSPRASIISTDSGIGTSVGGEVHRPPLRRDGSSSMPNSGSGMFQRDGEGGGSNHSAGAEFRHRVVAVADEDSPKWFWGTMSRQDCEDELKERGEIGNFVVRVNANGHHIMSFWRVDGVHHHKILTHDGIWRFEKAAVSAEGESLADLLDTYMKNCTKDKNIKPFGGGLFDNYTYAWAPQEFDMALLGKKLKQQKELREQARKPRRSQQHNYTPVEIDTGLDDEKGGFENDPEPEEVKKNKPLPLPPTKNAHSKSPRPSPGVKQRNTEPPPPPSSKEIFPGQNGPQTNAAGTALMQELAKKKALKPASNADSSLEKKKKYVVQSKPPPAPSPGKPSPAPSRTLAGQDGKESEPVYANTQFPPKEENSGYQNCDFSGPPQPSPKSEHAIKRKPSDLSGKTRAKQSDVGVALMQEFTKKKGPKSVSKTSEEIHDTKAQKLKETKPLAGKAVPAKTHAGAKQDIAESEPMYANTAVAEQSSDSGYQNCDFSGPPKPVGAATDSRQPLTTKKPKTAGVTKSASMTGKPRSKSGSGHTHFGTGGGARGHTNGGSVAGNSAGEYQNIQFGVKKK